MIELSERAEEILEAFWVEVIEAKKDRGNISLFKDDQAIKELVDASLAEIKGDQLILNSKGKEEARGCIRRHRLAERLMSDVLYVRSKSIEDVSCKLEHLLHKGLDENICTLLGHPKVCPHGKAIPPGECCKDIKRLPKKLLTPLTELELNKKVKIAYLQTKDRDTLQKIIAMGALPNSEVILIQKFPSYVFKIGRSQFAVDKELASCVYVRA